MMPITCLLSHHQEAKKLAREKSIKTVRSLHHIVRVAVLIAKYVHHIFWGLVKEEFVHSIKPP